MPPTVLLNSLQSVRKRVRFLGVLYGVGVALTVAVALLLAVVLIDYAMNLYPTPRVVAALGAIGVVVYVVGRWVIKPLLARLSLNDVAGRLEQAFPQFDDRLRSTVDFVQSEVPGSEVMKQRVVGEATDLANRLELGRAVVARPAWYAMGLGLGAIAFAALLAWMTPQYASIAVTRLLSPYRGQAWPKRVQIELAGDVPVRVPTGQRIEVKMKLARGDSASRKATIFYKYDDGPEQRELMIRSADGTYAASLDARVDSGKGAANLKIWMQAGDDEKSLMPITVVPRLAIKSVDAELTPPPYVGNQPPASVNLASAPAMVADGSTVKLKVGFTKPLATNAMVELTPASPEMPKPDISWQSDSPSSVNGAWLARKSLRFHIRATDIDGFSNTALEEYEIIVRPDQNPSVQIENPRRNEERTADSVVPLIGLAEDDYGIASLKLVVERYGAEKQKWELPLMENTAAVAPATATRAEGSADRLRFRVNHQWELAKLQDAKLKSGDILEYCLVIKDNFALDGQTHPEVASGRLRVTIVTPDELAGRVLDDLRQIRTQIQRVREGVDRNRAETRELANDTRDRTQLDAADRAQLDRLTNQQATNTSQTMQLAGRVQAIRDRLTENRMQSPELNDITRDVANDLQQAAENPMRQATNQLSAANRQNAANAQRNAGNNAQQQNNSTQQQQNANADTNAQQQQQPQQADANSQQARQQQDAQQPQQNATASPQRSQNAAAQPQNGQQQAGQQQTGQQQSQQSQQASGQQNSQQQSGQQQSGQQQASQQQPGQRQSGQQQQGGQQQNQQTASAQQGQQGQQAQQQPQQQAQDQQQNQAAPSTEQRNQALARAVENQQQASEQLQRAVDRMNGIGSLQETLARLRQLLEQQQQVSRQTRDVGRENVGRTPEQMRAEDRQQLNNIADQQQRLAEQTQQAMQEMQRQAEQMQRSDQNSSAAMRRAAQTGQQQQTAQNQQRASQQTRQNQQAQAQQAQRQAELGLQQMVDQLREAEQHKLAELQKQLEEMQNQIANLIRRQSGHNLDNLAAQGPEKITALEEQLRKSLFEAAERDPNEAVQPPQPTQLSSAQEQTERNTRDLSKSVEEISNGADTATHLNRAAGRMERAIVNLRDRKLPDAYDPYQVQALVELEAAAKTVDQQKEQVDEQVQDQQKENLRQRYVKVRAEQQKLNDETSKIDKSRGADGAIGRAETVRLGQMPGEQGKLSDTVGALNEDLTAAGSTVYIWANKDIVESMNEVKDDLGKQEVGVVTQSEQTRIVEQLDAMIKNLAVNRRRSPFAQENPENQQDQQQQQQRQQQANRGPRLPTEAELRLLQDLQRAVNKNTIVLDQQPERDKPRLTALGGRQGDLRGVLDEMIQKSSRGQMKLGPEPDASKQLPEEAKVEQIENQELEQDLLQGVPDAEKGEKQANLIGDRMARSRQRLADKIDPGQVTQLIQKRIIDDFDALIQQAREQEAQTRNSRQRQQQQQAQQQRQQQQAQRQARNQQQRNQQAQNQAQQQQQQNGQNPAVASRAPGESAINTDLTREIRETQAEWGAVSTRMREAAIDSQDEKPIEQYKPYVEDYVRSVSIKGAGQ